MDRRETLLALVVVLLVAMPVAGHVPTFPSDNTSPERAVDVPDSAKSWSFYDTLDRGSVAYYRLSLDGGDRLRAGTFTPDDSGFAPSLVVMGPELGASESVPPGVTVPEGMGVTVISGERPDAPAYEPFTPSANYHTTSVDRTIDEEGTYLIGIYEPANRSGQVGLALGHSEEFSPVEYVTVPFDLVRTHLWEGQHPLVVFGPLFVTLLGGLWLVKYRRQSDWDAAIEQYAVHVGGLFVVGTGLGTAVQMVLALARTGPTAGALVTTIFAGVPIACGLWALGAASAPKPLSEIRTRVGLVAAGLLSLATWGGFIVGPVLFFGAAILASVR